MMPEWKEKSDLEGTFSSLHLEEIELHIYQFICQNETYE